MPEWLGLALTGALLAANGFFVAAEFALVASRRSVLEPMAHDGSRRARTALRAMERISLMMAGAQLGITICSLALGALSEPAIAHLLEPLFEFVHLPTGAVHPAAFVIALALVTVLHVVLGEMIPKNLALAGPERAALWLAGPLTRVVTAVRPLIAVLNGASNALVRLFGVTPRDEVVSAFTRDEVAGMVAESHREGHLDAEEQALVRGAIRFTEQVAGDVAVPLGGVHTVARQQTPDEIEALSARTGFSRFPTEDLSGYVHVKHVLTTARRDRPIPVTVIRDLPSVRAEVTLRAALETMRAAGAHLALVTQGAEPTSLLAMEDVLDALLGGSSTVSR